MTFEGKVANRTAVKTVKEYVNTLCGKCAKLIPLPEDIIVGSKKSGYYICKSYLATEHFVYETKSGNAICYCSEYCARKHNHRFTK